MSERQKDIFFGTPVDFTMRRKFRRVRRLVGRVEGKRRAAELAGWYAQMRAIAKLSAEFGTFATDVESFIESMGGLVPDDEASAEYAEWLDDVVDVWGAFNEAKLIRIEGDPRNVADGFRVHVVDFDETNESRSLARKSSRVTPVTDPSCDVTMDDADRAAVYRENIKRRDAGQPRMTDEERDRWVLVTRRHVTSRHVTTEGRGGEGIEEQASVTPVTAPDGTPIASTAQILEWDAARQALEDDERYVYANQRLGSAATKLLEHQSESSGQPLHATERAVADVFDHPDSRQDGSSADALDTPTTDSQLRSGASTGSRGAA